MPYWGVGVSLSHLILDAVTSSDSSPIKSHVREYVCPSIGDPLGVMTSVSGGTVSMCINVYTGVYIILARGLTSILILSKLHSHCTKINFHNTRKLILYLLQGLCIMML